MRNTRYRSLAIGTLETVVKGSFSDFKLIMTIYRGFMYKPWALEFIVNIGFQQKTFRSSTETSSERSKLFTTLRVVPSDYHFF